MMLRKTKVTPAMARKLLAGSAYDRPIDPGSVKMSDKTLATLTNKRTRDSKPKSMATPHFRAIVMIPVEVKSRQNVKEHWAVQHRLKKAQQSAIDMHLIGMDLPKIGAIYPGPWSVRMVRLGCKQEMDGDNLAYCFKSIRDRIAEKLGLASDSADIWSYDQYSVGEPGVMITITKGA